MRVELCERIEIGGVTPSIKFIEEVSDLWKQNLIEGYVTVHVLIRCRGGDFYYSEEEIQTMKQQMQSIKEQFGDFIQGVVIGCLDPQTNTIHEQHLRELCQVASQFKNITFHRAFDLIPQELMPSQLKLLSKYNINRVLTSGCPTNAMDGKSMIKQLVQMAYPYSISIIAAGTIRDSNVQEILNDTQVTEVHSSCILHSFFEQQQQDNG